MTDTSIYGRLTDLASVLDAGIRDGDLGLPYETWLKVKGRFEPTVIGLRALADELLELAGNMRGRSAASLEDTGVEALGFLGEAMDQYADKLDTSGYVAPPSAGSTAYEMLAMAEQHTVETTEMLIHMVAATVLSKLIDDEGGGRCNVTFSPADMDAMYQRYDLTATREGMNTVVSIKAKPGAFSNGKLLEAALPPMSLYAEDGASTGEPAEPQVLAQERTERPLWATRIDGKLFPASNKAQAERLVFSNSKTDTVAQVENRFCYHKDCPAERCNHDERLNTALDIPEVTSDD